MRALVAGGADIIELGVPFSDPMADGPTIQRASERALKQGMSLRQVLATVREFRAGDASTPGGADGLCQPDRSDGRRRLRRRAGRRGRVDGVLVVDYPPEECGDFAREDQGAGIDPIFLLAPTSTEAAHRPGGRGGQRLHLLRVAEGRHRRRARSTSTRWRGAFPAIRPRSACRSASASASAMARRGASPQWPMRW
jgi:hypothetical protein